MRPSSKTLKDPTSLTELGEGCYAKAYLQRDGTVLKIAREGDGSMDYVEWCWLRMRKFGKGSLEMHGLPEVEHFGRLGTGWWAVMPRYVSVYALYPGNSSWTPGGGYVFGEAIKPVVALIEKVLGRWVNDIHRGNVMWDPKRKQWVVTDPLSDDATGTAPSAPQVRRFTKPMASWKRTPLQCVAFRR